jgi:alkylation response protein AidB-like acyl-CoA dehydrogenase
VDGGLRLYRCDRAQAEVTATPSTDPGRDLATVVLAETPAIAVGDAPVDLAVLGARAAILIAADSLGAAQKMLDMTVQYLGEREQFNVPIGTFQSLKHTAAEMLVDVEVSRSAAYFAAWSLDNGEADLGLHASVAKFVSGDAASRVADNALSLHGAVGFTWEHDLHFLYKRAKVNLSLFGTPGWHRQSIGDALPLRAGVGTQA